MGDPHSRAGGELVVPGDTKTPDFRRRLAITAPIVDLLTTHRAALDHEPARRTCTRHAHRHRDDLPSVPRTPTLRRLRLSTTCE